MLIDLVLGVAHGPKLGSFQQEMREYIPAAQARLLAHLDAKCDSHADEQHRGPPPDGLRSLAMSEDAPAALREAYEGACAALRAMRAYHLGIATHFLKRALTGTGETDFRAMLDEGICSTRAASMPREVKLE